MSKRGIIIGGGAFAREVLDWIQPHIQSGQLPAFKAFLDNDADAMNAFPELDLVHAGTPLEYAPQGEDIFLVAIGAPPAKSAIVDTLAAKGAVFAAAIHPTAVVSKHASIGAGVVIGPHVYVATHAILNDFASVNSLSGIGHDALVGRCATVSSQVDLMGGASLGQEAFVGSGARILPGVKIGDGAKVGAGSVVVRNVKASQGVFTAPARKL